MSNGKKSTCKQEREQLAELYRQVYDRCMEGESKAFDAKGALSALEQIGKMKGLAAPEQEAESEPVQIRLSKEARANGA